MNSKMNKFSTMMFTLSILLAVLVLPAAAETISVGSPSVAPGATTTVDIQVGGLTTDIAAATVVLAFNSSVVTVESVAAGDLGAPMAVNINNVTGSATLSFAATTAATTAPVKIATVTLKGVAGAAVGATSALTLTVNALSDAAGANKAAGIVITNGLATINAASGAVRVYIVSDNPNAMPSWDAQSFAGFFYDIKYNRKTENLFITRTMASLNATRTIDKNQLIYTTEKANVDFKVYEKETKTVLGSRDYPVVGWMAEKWVAVKGKANKLAKLVYEMDKEDKKTLTTGETWALGAGYELTINALDARTTPRQVWFTLKKDGAVIDEGISDEKNVYTKTMTIQGESDALLFTMYVDRIFSGATSDMAQFKYAWLIDGSTAIEVKSADKYGPFEVTTANSEDIRLENTNSVSLSKNSETTVLGNIKFVIADSDVLRFYPKVDYVIGDGQVPIVTGATPRANVTTTAKATTTLTTVPTTTKPPEVATTSATTTNTTKPTTTPTEPGFEAMFAIAGLLAVAFLVLRQRK